MVEQMQKKNEQERKVSNLEALHSRLFDVDSTHQIRCRKLSFSVFLFFHDDDGNGDCLVVGRYELRSSAHTNQEGASLQVEGRYITYVSDS